MVLVPKSEKARDSGCRIGKEEDDVLYDLRLARRWKRRRIAYENGGVNSCSNTGMKKTVGQNNKCNDAFVVDSDYVNPLDERDVDLNDQKYLNDEEGFVDFDVGCVNYAAADSDDNVREVSDPHYIIFLDNLKEDGKSYVLELDLDETLVVVKYEKEDDLNNKLDVENWETSKCHLKQWKVGIDNVLKSCLRRERLEIPRRVLRSNSSKQESESLRMNCRSNADAEKTENSQKVLFSNSWKRKTENPSKTLRSESKRKNNENSSIMHDVGKRVQMEIPRILRSNSRREDNGSSRILQDAETNLKEPVVEKNVEKETENPNSSACCSKDLVDESYREFLKALKDGQHLEYTPEGHKKVICEESDSENIAEDHSLPSKRNSLEVTKPNFHCNPRANSDLVDESYLEFLKLLKDGEHLNCTFDGGEKVIYYDSEVTILEDNPHDIVDLDGEECIQNPGSEFREELMEILRKPYDRVEYEKVWQEASIQKPLEGLKVLRSRMISYKRDVYGKSYLERDGYRDLASAVSQAQGDRRRILNLLRGFFYWLQNLARKGAFKPWLDSSCLSILPPPGRFASGKMCSVSNPSI